MEWIRKAPLPDSRRPGPAPDAPSAGAVGLFPAAFHPPTRAHMALAEAALKVVEEVVFILPKAFPHKSYDQVGLAERLEMLLAATEGNGRFSVAVSEGGLFIDIVREARPHYPPGTEFWFLCGSDAAERIVNWDYGQAGEFAHQLQEFGLLVADRREPYDPPAAYAGRIRRLPLEERFQEISSTAVRERIHSGGRWEQWVPDNVVELVRRYYS